MTAEAAGPTAAVRRYVSIAWRLNFKHEMLVVQNFDGNVVFILPFQFADRIKILRDGAWYDVQPAIQVILNCAQQTAGTVCVG